MTIIKNSDQGKALRALVKATAPVMLSIDRDRCFALAIKFPRGVHGPIEGVSNAKLRDLILAWERASDAVKMMDGK